jgi:integrase
MARGSVFRPTYVYQGEKRTSGTWWVSYSRNGRRYRESSGSEVKADAEALLIRRLAQTRPDGPHPTEAGLFRFEELADLLRDDYKRKRNKSDPERRIRHLARHFNGERAMDIGETAIDRYVAARVRGGAAGATVNRELAALRRMLRLAYRLRWIGHVPTFQMLGENVREGFVTEEGIARLLPELPEHVRPLAEALYVTAWRVSDMLSRTWADVDFDGGWLRIEGSQTKEGKGRQFPLIPRLRAILEEQRARADALEAKPTGRPVESLFFYLEGARAGQPIRDFRGSWASACERAKMPDLRVHDLRRSGIRSFVRAGMPENLAMRLSGHATPSVFRRYDIISEGDLQDGGDKLSAYFLTKNGQRDRQSGKVATG